MARIRRRLRKLGVRRRHRTQSADRPVSGWQSLTDAERAASELVAQGLSNRQVANRMYISAHTVAFYMRQAFRKLNISSRVELTRIVIQQSQQPATVNPMQMPQLPRGGPSHQAEGLGRRGRGDPATMRSPRAK
jgi:DNA-binding CsgD family transcriptional regulator